MTLYKVQCFEHNGEPYGRYFPDILNYFHGLTCEDYGHITEAIKACKKSDSCVCKVVEANIFPLPGGQIGKTYKRDEVEVGLQVHMESKDKWEDRDINEIDAYRFSGSKWDTRKIFRLLPQPVEKEPETVDNDIYFEVAEIAQNNLIIQDPEKFKEAHLKHPWNEKAKKKYHAQVQFDALQFIRDLKRRYVITKQEASR